MTVQIFDPPVSGLPQGLLARWREIPVPVAVDLAPACRIGPGIRPLCPASRQPRLCALAVTVRCAPPDFGAVLKALELVGPGQVLVIDAGGHADNAMIGDVLGGFLHRRGAAGIVCDGAIRDTGTLARLDGFSVYSRHVNPRGPVGSERGSVNLSVSIAGVQVNPGDLVLGDDDGLAVLTPDMLHALIDAAEAKLRLEADWTRRLADGSPVDSVFGLD